MHRCSANFTYILVKPPMLLAHLAINPEVQGLKLAVDIFYFVTHVGQVHASTQTKYKA